MRHKPLEYNNRRCRIISSPRSTFNNSLTTTNVQRRCPSFSSRTPSGALLSLSHLPQVLRAFHPVVSAAHALSTSSSLISELPPEGVEEPPRPVPALGTGLTLRSSSPWPVENSDLSQGLRISQPHHFTWLPQCSAAPHQRK